MSDQVKTVKHYLDYHAKHNPDKIFVICPHTKKQISFLEFKQNIEKIVSYLREQNLQKGDAVCTVIENSISSIYLMLGIMYAGMVQVPLNVVAGEDQLSYVLDHSDSNIVFTSHQYLDLSKKLIQKQTRKIELITVDKNTFIDQLNQSASPFAIEVEESNPALLMYTSGTTGKPKGVMLSNKNIISGGQNCIDAHDITTKDRAMCVLPLFHINGAINTVLAPLISGSSVVLCEKFSVNNFWKFISEFQCTWFSVVPTIISSLINKFDGTAMKHIDLKNFRFGRSASAALAPETHKKFEELFKIPLIETMGLTETCSPILSNPMPPKIIKYGSPGIAVGNEVKIFDDTFKEVARNTIGQIVVRGDNVMKEYYKNPEATEKSFSQDWLLTGDLGLMDEDGFVFVRGRIKELIIKGGENISPREIDDVLYQNSEIVEAAAFAVACDHYGEKVEAGVVIKENSSINEKELIEHCASLLGAFKSPSKIHFLKELPKGSSGKIQRLKIKDIIYPAK